MQEYGYSRWNSHQETYHFLYGKIGVETGFFNQLFLDVYLGCYAGIVVIPFIGLRPRYVIKLHEYYKIELGGSINYTTHRTDFYNLHIGIVLF